MGVPVRIGVLLGEALLEGVLLGELVAEPVWELEAVELPVSLALLVIVGDCDGVCVGVGCVFWKLMLSSWCRSVLPPVPAEAPTYAHCVNGAQPRMACRSTLRHVNECIALPAETSVMLATSDLVACEYEMTTDHTSELQKSHPYIQM